MKFLRILSVAVVFAFQNQAAARQAPPVVVTSIKPIHSLISALMIGVGEPHLIVRGLGSPHTYSLRPSDARALQRARLVFWIGPEFETFLRAPLKALVGTRNAISLADAPGTIERRPIRRDVERARRDEARDGAMGPRDMHLWLDPRNAIAMVRGARRALSEADPQNDRLYRANGQRTIGKLERLVAEVEDRIAGVRDRPFVVFHDAYGHFEQRFDIRAAAAIAVDPGRPPGAGRLSVIRAEIARLDAACVFAEPQFSPSLVRLLTEGTGARSGSLDPLGASIEAGPDHYFGLIRQIASSLRSCLS